MIRINLLSKRRTKRVDKGEQSLLLGFLIAVAAGLLVFLLIHRPLSGDIDDTTKTTSRLRQDIKQLQAQTAGHAELKTTIAEAEKRMAAIQTLDAARAVPAHVLFELARILTPNRQPTMTEEMAATVNTNSNREMAPDWDPKHVWVTEFSENKGRFKLSGGAQSDGDMTQLALRLGASVYFEDVTPEGGVETIDREAGISYYQFTISGKVVY
jgi:Tfp pilus assembly protein PilN